MNKKARKRLVIATAVLVVAFVAVIGWLLWQQSATYLHVGELAAKYDGRKVQVSGKVQSGSVVKDADGVSFVIVEDRIDKPQTTVAVKYAGVAPDTLESSGAFAIVEGSYDAAGGLVVADAVKTKCPSKYKSQAETPAAQTSP